ncbi:MAG TPA: gliding motility-associated C-terminal domain-containing protein, partial [Flavobacterium sp.]|nr:gliding motility-associated C-terminal domain-containing protein [Flavobacterium sp.]
DLAFPANTNDVTISFYWKGVGQGSGSYFYDYMTVWLMPSTYQPAEGVQITADDGGIQLGAEFNNQEDWVQYFELLELSDFAGQTGRLIFEWTNNTYTNNPPPAAVDNVEVKLVTCSRPIEVAVEKNQITGDLLATWTPVAGETQWEVIVQDASEPAPDDTATGVIVDEPQYLIEDVVEGEFYKIYVRAICSEDDNSLWTEGVDFSDFNPPACANIDMTFPDLNIDEMGDFIYCAADGELTLPLVADFDDSMFKSTTSYEVEQIEYAPPFPFLGGNVVPIEYDDDYTPSFDLPFNFCFFGNEYSYCRIGDNGVVTFGLPYTTDVEYCPWQLEGLQIPDPDFNIKNSIYGVFQDMLVTNNPGPDSQINYQVLGTYPCRALVVNFNEVPAFGDEDEEFRTTSQIVLYEITNIIEVYVKKRTADTSWPSEFSGLPGEGLLGIQNEDGTLAYTPPGRNTGAWDAEEEAWRFSPNGETSVEFGWYINGEFYSDNPNDQITITEDTCVEARVTYPGCGGDDLVLSKGYCVKVAPEVVLDKPEDIKVCPVDGEFAPIDLTQKIPEAVETLAQNDNFDLNDYDITFHQSEDAATGDLEAISNPENYVPNPDETIWIRVEHKSTGCFGLTSFEIFEGVGLALNRPDDVILCVYYDIIPETDLSQVNEQLLANISGDEELIVNYYNSQEDAIYGTNPIEDWANFEAPYLPYEVWVKVSGSAEVCESVISFQLVEGEGLPEYEHVDFDICTAYVLPELPEGYFYTTEYLAEGDRINPGTVIEGLGLHTIYVNVISKEGCITSSSYNVNIIECSVPRGVSPNGDGLNDSFDLTDYFLLDLKIYNRDGREVYSHGMGYTNEWEGQSNNGNLLPDGTYYYRVITPVEELTGWVQLVRELK